MRFMLFKIRQRKYNRIKINKYYGFKRDCAKRYSTQKPTPRIDSTEAVGGSVALIEGGFKMSKNGN